MTKEERDNLTYQLAASLHTVQNFEQALQGDNMANLKTKAEAEFVLVLKDGRKFWEGMEVEWYFSGNDCWRKRIVSIESIDGKYIPLRWIIDHPDFVRIPAPPPEKTPLEIMREADRIINVERRVWKLSSNELMHIGGRVDLEGDCISLAALDIEGLEILLDSGEWKNLKEMVG